MASNPDVLALLEEMLVRDQRFTVVGVVTLPKDFFGEEFLKAYTAMRRHELSRFADWVSDWEREEYIDLF